MPNVGDRTGTDRPNQYDVYVSSSRAYVFFDGKAYGCAELPAGKFKPGPVSVTFGDVLYHTGADVAPAPNGANLDWIYQLHSRHLVWETRHHYDNLGFSSGVPEPAWDGKNIPCRTATTLTE